MHLNLILNQDLAVNLHEGIFNHRIKQVSIVPNTLATNYHSKVFLRTLRKVRTEESSVT